MVLVHGHGLHDDGRTIHHLQHHRVHSDLLGLRTTVAPLRPLMAQFRMHFMMDNAAFDETPLPEITQILDEIKQSVSNGAIGGLITDSNGNGIGSWVMEGHGERYAEEE